jgi:DNA-binding response OmpR family regulator
LYADSTDTLQDLRLPEGAAPTPVLLIDPDAASLDFMARALAQAGYQPLPYDRPDPDAGAPARLGADPEVPVVILDARCVDPAAGGVPLGDLRRRAVRRSALQFVLIGQSEGLDRALRRHPTEIADVLPKPVERTTLLYAVREAQRRHAAQIGRNGATSVAESHRRNTQTRPEMPADLRVLHWLREIDDQRARALDGIAEPDATWNMLAELLRARLTRRRVSVTSLCLASRSPVTSALRRIERLLAAGLITYTLDPKDRRRKYIDLTSDGLARVQAAVRGAAQQINSPDHPLSARPPEHAAPPPP